MTSLALAAAFAAAGGSAANAATCDHLIPPSGDATTVGRQITADDLLRLRDFGPHSVGDPREKLFSLSPDHSRLALQIRQADPDSNRYCLAVEVISLSGEGKPVIADQGGAFRLVHFDVAGFVAHTSPGIAADDTPVWSPDGRWLAFLRRDHGVTQVWRARADGGFSEPLTHGQVDVESVVWSRDGRSLLLSERPALADARTAIAAEGLKGYRFDDRFEPEASATPQVRAPAPIVTYRLDVASGALTSVQPQSVAPDAPGAQAELPGAALRVVGEGGTEAAIVADKPGVLAGPSYIHVRWPDGVTAACRRAMCSGGQDLIWLDDQSLVILARNFGDSQTRVLYWRQGAPDPVLVLTTEDVLLGCQADRRRLICGHEASKQPRRLVSLDPVTGHMTPLFDLNPEFRNLDLGQVTRLHWVNNRGIATFGDLVTPPGYEPGRRLPLIVVQYVTRGFLRGGTGDDYPIWLFAAHGFAVLSFQRPPDVGFVAGVTSFDEVNQRDIDGWADRWSVLSAMETGIAKAVSLGVADPQHVGLTGLSDGATNVQFALMHGAPVAAAALSSCCEDTWTMGPLLGPVAARWFESMGYPRFGTEQDAFWAPISVTQNASHIDTPLLMQVPDREYLGALSAYSALKSAGKPVDMYVFPNEYHVKWQPAHRRAIYQRNLDWFRFWLKGEEDPNPANAEQYKGWRAMRANLSHMSATPGP
ncbi:MAG TPA: Atxe2 family lasso peptide isopeptidase [Asticcacaulis sp.]|nr:Atxe2 family lasso peptide isopeptidase [Asticcacaulis sp.]